MANYDLGTIGYTVQNTGAEKATQEVKKLGDAAQKVMNEFQRQKAVMALVKKATDDTSTSFRRLSVAELQQTSNRLQGLDRALATSRRGMGNLGVGVQQVGYQVGDFLVQVQSGTNWMVAFGQQATQLVGILPSFASKLGMSVSSLIGISSGLGIAIPLITAIGAAFIRTKEEVEDYNKPLKDALDITKKLREQTDKIRFPDSVKKSVDDLTTRFEEAQKKVSDLQSQILLGNIAAGQGGVGAIMFALKQDALKEELALSQLTLDNLKEEIRLRDLIVQRENANNALAAGELAKQKRERENFVNYVVQQYQYMAKTRAESDAKAKKAADDAAIVEEKAVELALRKKDIFHALAGETASVSVFMGEAYKNAVALANVNFSNIHNLPQGFSAKDYSDLALGGARADRRTAGAPPPPPKPIIPVSTGAGTGGGSAENALASFQKQLDLERALVGTSEAYQKVRQALGDEFAKTNPEVISGLIKQAEETQKLIDLENQRKALLESVKGSLEEGFMSMVEGTKSVKDAFRSMAADIIRELYRVLVVQRLVNGISGAVSGLPMFGGAAPAAGPVGIGVSKMPAPTSLAMSNQGGVSVVQNINITGTGDAAYVRNEIAKSMPKITEATKAAVIDARRRGGQMKQAFM